MHFSERKDTHDPEEEFGLIEDVCEPKDWEERKYYHPIKE
jgi:hypothetical protein